MWYAITGGFLLLAFVFWLWLDKQLRFDDDAKDKPTNRSPDRMG